MKEDAKKRKRIRPALTPEAREDQLIALATNLAEKQLLEGTASSQVITHYLKMGSTKERLEREIMKEQKEMIDGYAVENSVWIGEKRIIFAIHPDKNEEYPYLKCVAVDNGIITRYENAVASDDYFEAMKLFADGTDLVQKCVELLSGAFMLTAEAILSGLTHSYLKSEQADGTPFTEKGADNLRALGINFIWIPIVAIAASEAVALWQDVESSGVTDNFGSVMTGIVLIIASLIFRYGAELEKGKGSADTEKE